MRSTTASALCLACSIVALAVACSQDSAEQEIEHYPVDDMEGIITRSDVRIDSERTSDGGGSLHIAAASPATVRLYETGDIDLENSRLIYRARLRSEGLEGKAYLEMWCHFPGKGDFFSRALHSPLSGTQEWITQETPFFLKEGENPDNVKLNLVVAGKGDVWIDDIRLLKAPLQ